MSAITLMRRMGGAAGRWLVARPWAIRGRIARDLAARSLGSPQGAPAIAALFRSPNDAAAAIALRVATEGRRAPISAELLIDRLATGARPELLLAAVSYARVLGIEAPRAEWLSHISVSSLDVARLGRFVNEVAHLAEEERSHVLASAQSGQTEAAREAIRVMLGTWQEIETGEIGGALETAVTDVRVRVALAYRAHSLPYEALVDLGRTLQEGAEVDADATLVVCRALRDAGDYSLSTALAERVLTARPASVAARSLKNNGISALTSVREGWSAPRRERRDGSPPQVGTIPYLLHSALPQVSMGYATRSHGILTALREAGWAVEGITRPGFPLDDARIDNAPSTDVVDGVPYHHVLFESRRPLPLLPVERGVATFSRALRDLYKDADVPLVHAASNFRNGLAAVHAARKLGVPALYEVRGLWEYTRLAREPWFDRTDSFQFISRMETAAAHEADHVIAITRALADLLVERGVDAGKISVVPNGVDTRRFTPRSRDAELAEELGIGGRTVIGYVGSLLEYEGLHLLIEAVDLLRRDDFVVLIVGDGRTRPELERLVTDRGLQEAVRFTGRVPHEEVERYYSLVDVAPFPRTPVAVTELVSPLKPFEAMAMGKAVVASDVAALEEIIEDGVNGRLFPKGSPDALASVLEELIDDPGATSRMAQRGAEWVRRERDWKTLAQGVASVYEDLGATRP